MEVRSGIILSHLPPYLQFLFLFGPGWRAKLYRRAPGGTISPLDSANKNPRSSIGRRLYSVGPQLEERGWDFVDHSSSAIRVAVDRRL